MISNHNHSPNPYTDLIEHTLILGAAPCLSWHPSFRASEQRSNDFSTYQINHGQTNPKKCQTSVGCSDYESTQGHFVPVCDK